MFVWGNRDPFVSRAAAELCGRYVAGPYRGTELDGASHWLPEQAAGQVAALLAEHFHGQPGASPVPPCSPGPDTS
jgi:pimeloyl-ACP methyl ester carboxylesterase